MAAYDCVVVGAGLSGATFAERAASALGWRVLVVDKRDHVGGNVYDEVDAETGIRVSRYGPHLFHTNDAGVWEYVQRFGAWRRWDHRVLSQVGDALVPVPANANTVNALFGANLASEADMRAWVAQEVQGREDDATNSEEVAVARVGRRLFAALFQAYTRKQWGREASEMEPLVLQRIPVRTGFDDRYFGDRYQALPVDGYAALVQRMLDHPRITVRLGCDFLAHRAELQAAAGRLLVYTGPIDAYFADSGLPRLEYRSIQFERSVVECTGYVQPAAVVNFADAEVPYTRRTEYKHFLRQASSKSVLVAERSTGQGEPYYPVPTRANMELYERYRALAAAAEAGGSLMFLGRLATYKYINMDAAVRLALDAVERVVQQQQQQQQQQQRP